MRSEWDKGAAYEGIQIQVGSDEFGERVKSGNSVIGIILWFPLNLLSAKNKWP